MSHETDVRRAQRAQEVLDNPVYAEAWAAIETEIVTQWRQARNADDREQLHKLLLMHEKAKTALESVMRSGEVSKVELTRQRTRAEAMTGHLLARG